MTEAKENVEQTNGNNHALTETHFGTINGIVTTRLHTVGENVEVGVCYTNKAYVWGKYLIMTPTIPYRKVITTETLDTRLIGRTDETYDEIKLLSQLPTKFVVDNVNTEIYLHASYCAFGFNEFEVEQVNGFTCKVYDVNNNLLFDGTEQGDGLYKFNVYKDSEQAKNNSAVMKLDNMCQYWEITKENIVSTDDGAGNVTLTTEVISV